jgi:hypothetical protein
MLKIKQYVSYLFQIRGLLKLLLQLQILCHITMLYLLATKLAYLKLTTF